MADEKRMHIVLPYFIDLKTDKEEHREPVYVANIFRGDMFGKIYTTWTQPALVTSPHTLSASKIVIIFVSHNSRELPLIKPLVGAWSDIQHTYNAMIQVPIKTTSGELGIEPEEAVQEEAVQKAFEEIAASSSRILKSIERINSLAGETINEFSAAKGTLSLMGKA